MGITGTIFLGFLLLLFEFQVVTLFMLCKKIEERIDEVKDRQHGLSNLFKESKKRVKNKKAR